MSEYWKSTPTYWCKFCSQYVRDTPLEKKNHDASAKHQNGIQRSLRELHKRSDREAREKARAKSEVERLNGIVGGSKGAGGGGGGVRVEGLRDLGAGGAGPGANLTSAQQRKAHAEQLAALGVQLPEALRKEVTGVGGWETVSERVVVDEDDAGGGRSMADILKRENDIKSEEEKVGGEVVSSRGVRKRKIEGDEDEDDESQAAAARRMSRKEAWGSKIKTYPGGSGRGTHGDAEGSGEEEDLEVLLSGITAKRKANMEEEGQEQTDAKLEDGEASAVIKKEAAAADGDDETKPSRLALNNNEDSEAEAEAVKEEDETSRIDAPPVVFFKKRKAKR